MTRPTFLSLFSGIGGLDLGLEWAGWSCVGQVEIDPYCQRVLAKHWPDVPRWGDIKELDPDELPRADLVAGGFPCQPVSAAGQWFAQNDPRWLWPDFYRTIGVLRPRHVLVENVPGLLDRGMGDVIDGLATLGYDAEWSVVSACAVGAPHTRERLFILAYPPGERLERSGLTTYEGATLLAGEGLRQGHRRHWSVEPRPDGVAYGVPSRVDRLRGHGNAVVPQVAELIGRRILEAAA